MEQLVVSKLRNLATLRVQAASRRSPASLPFCSQTLLAFVSSRDSTEEGIFREPSKYVIDAAERDKDLAELQSQPDARGFVAVMERAQERGELSRSHDARELVASILGPILYREALAKQVVNRALRNTD